MDRLAAAVDAVGAKGYILVVGIHRDDDDDDDDDEEEDKEVGSSHVFRLSYCQYM